LRPKSIWWLEDSSAASDTPGLRRRSKSNARMTVSLLWRIARFRW
jgi:hypothetical protein